MAEDLLIEEDLIEPPVFEEDDDEFDEFGSISTVLTEEQRECIDWCKARLAEPKTLDENGVPQPKVIRIDGPAGSGKSTLMKELQRELYQSGYAMVQACAATNKAARNLNSKGIPAVTLHQATMRPLFGPPYKELNALFDRAAIHDVKKPQFSEELLDDFSEEKLLEAIAKAKHYGLSAAMRSLGITDAFKYVEGWVAADPNLNSTLLIDEASMVGQYEFDKAKTVYPDGVVLIGDEWQLSPVKQKRILAKIKPVFRLTQIHRQAEGSQPLELALKIRRGEKIGNVTSVPVSSQLCREGIPVLVWTNDTRKKITLTTRRVLGFGKNPPQVGETLVCRSSDLQAKSRGLVMNSLWKVTKADGWNFTLENDEGVSLDDVYLFCEELDQPNDGFAFRFAYALTAHTAQGSEWTQIMIHLPDMHKLFAFRKKKQLEENPAEEAEPDEAELWIYTAITRAKQEVIWVRDEVR